ncbi:MAG: alkaline phosphatase [Bacteroidia bacterium]|nr:alkaline phosphatase [Bacteroidia bacterium]
MRLWIFPLVMITVLAGCQTAQPVTTDVRPSRKAKNIILMVGDGMGLTQVTAGLYANKNHLNLEMFPVVGLSKTSSADDLITDSAAGATAFSAGEKTYNGAIALSVDSLPLVTILELAEQAGKSTGMVVTCEVTHATPACFIAHQPSRNMHEAIAADFLKTDIDLFIGGGMNYFARRIDQRNLIAELLSKDYLVMDWTVDLNSLDKTTRKNLAYFTAADKPLPYSKGRTYLPDASRFAATFLDNRSKEGFFLMIEGSQIDWGGHEMDGPYVISEMLDFDRAIGQILEFAAADGETLVIVTADHETGGLAITGKDDAGDLKTAFIYDHHTPAMVPVFAFGPGAEAFAGIYENTALFTKMKNAYGWK